MLEMKARLPLLDSLSKKSNALMSGSGTSSASTALPFSTKCDALMSGSGTSSASIALPFSKKCDALMSGSGTTSASTALPFSASSRTSLSDNGVSAQAHEGFLEDQYQKYFINTDNSGQTLMWHGMP